MNLGELDIVTDRFDNRISAVSEHWLAGVDGWHSVIYCTGFTKGQQGDWKAGSQLHGVLSALASF